MGFKNWLRTNLSDELWQVLRTANARQKSSRLYLKDRTAHILDKTYECDVHGKKIKICVSNSLEKYRAETYSTKEPETLDWLDQNLRSTDIFFDIGANVGLYSLYAAKIRPNAKIFGFEPESQNFARFCRNVHVNRFENVVPCSLAVTDRMTFDYFELSEFTAGSSLHGLGGTSPFGVDKANIPVMRQGALGISVDELVTNFKLPVPNLIKVDVDGIEDKIFSGMSQTLANPAVRSVLVEITSENDESSYIEKHLASFGFKGTGTGKKYEYGKYLCQNFVFTRA